MTMSRHASRLFAIIFAVFTTAQPARAAVPLVVILGGPTISAISEAALGGTMMFMVLSLTGDTPTDQRFALPLADGPEGEPPAPSASPTSPVVPGTTQACLGPAMISCAPTGEQSCQSAGGSWNSFNQSCTINQQICESAGYVGCGSSQSVFISPSTSGATCSKGYTMTDGVCVLSNPRQATSDNRCDLQFSGSGSGSKYLYFDDADCPGGAQVDYGPGVAVMRDSGRLVYMSATDSSGRPVLVEVAVADDGSRTYVRHYTQVSESGGTAVQTRQLTIDRPTGRVTEYSMVTNPGSISQPGSTSVPTSTDGAPTVADTPTVNTNQQQMVQSVEVCGLPGKMDCSVDDSGFAIPAPLVEVPDADLNVQKTKIEEITDPGFVASLVPNLTPGSPMACRPLEFRGKVDSGPAAGLDSTASFDICWVFGIGRSVLGYLFWLGGVLYVWRRFTGGSPAGA